MKNLIVILLLAASVLAQNEITPVTTADSLFNAGNYFDSVTEYKRALFFNDSSAGKFYIYFKIGLCYKIGAKYENALKYFAHALLSTENPEEKYEVKEQIIRINILRRTTDQAYYLLTELEKGGKVEMDKIHYWRGWAYMFDDKWEEAAFEFSLIEKDHQLKKFCESVNNEKYSVNLAKLFSYIIPGSGQLYTGEYLSGLMSLGWNLLCGYWTINSFIEDRVFDGLVVGNLLWLRFYRGNYQNAEKFAVSKNIKMMNTAYRYLKNNYEGIKP